MTHVLAALLALLFPVLASAPPAPDPAPAPAPQRGVVAGVVGEWETATPIGDTLLIGPLNGRDHLLYAVRGPEGVRISTGIRQGDRLLRTAGVLQPADGIELYGGEPLDGGEYRLLGVVDGDRDVAVEGPDGTTRPVTATSTSVVPGWTVFVDRAAFEEGWDPLQFPPLDVVSGEDRVSVREVSWTG